ncbi:MAG: L,D-transpeptidase [Solirubrobacterales bacterium]
MSPRMTLPLALLAAGICLLASASTAPARAGAVARTQALVVVVRDHVVRARPSADARRIDVVAARRPLTRVRTVLPLLASAGPEDTWLRVRLPGRPNGHAGWIAAKGTRADSTGWRIRVSVGQRRVDVFYGGRRLRSFRAIVGAPATPTPRGSFFVEEALALSGYEPGAPYALATSARSNVLQEFEGGPGQIALHGTRNVSGALGSAVSHGCVRLGTRAIAWLASRIGAGVPLAIGR